MKIGILQCGHAAAEIAARDGDYAAMFARLLDGRGFSFAAWNVVDLEFPPGIHAADGWLLTGSKHGVYDDLPFIPRLERFVRDAFAARVPLVGVCFGHQLLAQALGGRVAKFPGGWAVGRQEYQFTGIGRLSLNAWHQDQVLEPPPGARTIATSDFCRYAGLAYGDGAISVQAHPEFSNAVIADLIRLRRGTGSYPDTLLDAAASHLAEPPDNRPLAQLIADFFLAHEGQRQLAAAAAGPQRSGTDG